MKIIKKDETIMKDLSEELKIINKGINIRNFNSE
jgi:hypothetical protein